MLFLCISIFRRVPINRALVYRTWDGAVFSNPFVLRFFQTPKQGWADMKLHPFLVSIYLLTAVGVERSGKKKVADMGNYVNSHLTKQEHVVFEAHYHWCIWILPIIGFVSFSIPLLLIIGFTINYASSDGVDDIIILPCLIFLIGLWILIYTYIKTTTDEFAISNQRLIIKTGVISISTLELNLTKVETITVSQGIFGRIFNCGQIAIKGTGATICNLICINTPYDFRKQFQDVLGKYIPSNVNDGYNNKPKTTIVTTVLPNVPSNNNEGSGIIGKSENLMKIKELLDSGILTQEEFDNEKKKILNS